MADRFIVRKGDTIEVKSGLTDADILEMYESLSAHVVFRVAGKTVEYADALPRTEEIIWKKAQRM